jgi:hypothetical protein
MTPKLHCIIIATIKPNDPYHRELIDYARSRGMDWAKCDTPENLAKDLHTLKQKGAFLPTKPGVCIFDDFCSETKKKSYMNCMENVVATYRGEGLNFICITQHPSMLPTYVRTNLQTRFDFIEECRSASDVQASNLRLPDGPEYAAMYHELQDFLRQVRYGYLWHCSQPWKIGAGYGNHMLTVADLNQVIIPAANDELYKTLKRMVKKDQIASYERDKEAQRKMGNDAPELTCDRRELEKKGKLSPVRSGGKLSPVRSGGKSDDSSDVEADSDLDTSSR